MMKMCLKNCNFEKITLNKFKKMRKVALITGATAGIGKAIAVKLAENKFDLILTGRRSARLDALKRVLEKKHVHVNTLCFDIRSENEVKTAIENLSDVWKNIDVLVNNAGLSVGLDPIQDGDTDDWNRMIDTNLKGLLYVTRSVVPLMRERVKGHILNIGSIAGKEVYSNGNVYCATKHAVDALTKAMRIDLVQYGIRVSQICPGAVETEFSIVRFKGDKARADKVYEGYENLLAEDVAECVAFCVSRPPHVTINDMVVMPTAQASATIFHKQLLGCR